MNFQNLTPHTINIKTDEGLELEVPASGIIARVEQTYKDDDVIAGIPVVTTAYGEVQNLPQSNPGTIFIVSGLVLSALKGSSRFDCVAPDTGAGAIRDESGKIIGTKRFIGN